MKKPRSAALVASFAALSLAVVTILAVLAYTNHRAAVFYRRQTYNCYRRSFNALAAGIGELDSALQKCVFSGTPGMVRLTLTRVFGAAETAKQALGALPRGDIEFTRTSGFISRTGDYAFALTKKLSGGEALSEEESRNLKTLSETASVLSGNLFELLGEINNGKLTFGELADAEKRAGEALPEGAGGGFSERVKATEEEFPEIPSLIYDGPFSTHISGMTSRMIEGKPEVTRERALEIAEDFLGAGSLSFDGKRAGNLPVYRFSRRTSGDAVSIEVSETGGAVVNMYSARIPGDASEESADAAGTAARFLEERGFGNMRESYRVTRGGTTTVNFAYEQDGVICYTDLIKVDVALDTGEVSGFEAQGYIMHHRARELPPPQVSEEEARGKVSKELKILSRSLAVIPTDGKNEAFCHEFKCEASDGRRYIVYIDAETGREERVLILIEDENGSLAL
ncbi:MAG: germination protein YpeB [Oscillospiraceae bacterium]|jgi:germination protein YpeB|nr:germination protein YpeB [Oscillospiraceae bacterium]